MIHRIAAGVLFAAGVCLSPAYAELTAAADFEAGSIGKCEASGVNHLRCAVIGETDQDGRNRQASWFYFRLEGGDGEEVTIDFVDLAGEYNYQPTKGPITDKTPPVLSYDQKAWRHVEASALEYDPEEPRLRLRFKPERFPVWIARIPPYTTAHLERLIERYADSPYLTKEVVGKTVEGRDMLLLTITDPESPPEGKKVLWFMFRQHAWETDTSWTGEGAIRFLLGRELKATQIRRNAIIKIFPLCDPDGVARGGVRFNANGYDLNRNWDTIDPAKMPEIAAQHKAIASWLEAGNRLDLFLTLHNTETSEYIDGPPEDAHPLHFDTLNRLYKTLRAFTKFSATREPRRSRRSTSDDKPGRMNVVQGLSKDFDIAAFLMEQMIAAPLKLGRPPTIADRLQFGADLMIVAEWSAPKPVTRVTRPSRR